MNFTDEDTDDIITSRDAYKNELPDIVAMLDYLVDKKIVSFDEDDNYMHIYTAPYQDWGRTLIVGQKFDTTQLVFMVITIPKPPDPKNAGKKLMGWGTKLQVSFMGLETMHTNALKKFDPRLGSAKRKINSQFYKHEIPDYGSTKRMLEAIVESACGVLAKLGGKYDYLLPQLLLIGYSGVFKRTKFSILENLGVEEKEISECLKFLISKTPLDRILFYWKQGVSFNDFKKSQVNLNDLPEEWLEELFPAGS